MNQAKLWLRAAILCICGACITTCCTSSDDDENQLNKWPAGQWLYEGRWLDYDNINAVVLDVATYSDGSEKSINIYARSVTDGQWYWYPSTDTYYIDLTAGIVRFSGKTFTYKLTDTTLTLTIGGKQYPFRHTSGIRIDVDDFPPTVSEK